MKKLSINIFIIMALPLYMKAQQVNYKVLKDDPKDINNIWVYLDLAQMDMGFKNIDGTSFNFGIWGTGDYQNKFGGDFIFRKAWITLGKLGGSGVDGGKLNGHSQFELGGYYKLKESTGSGNANIILSQETNYVSGKEVTATRSIKVPVTKVKGTYVRGGVMSMGGVYGMSHVKDNVVDFTEWMSFPDRINYRMSGIYTGLLFTKTTNIIINTDTDGKAAKSKKSRIYADAMILPIQSAKLLDVNYKPAINAGILGFRLGWQTLPTELRKVKNIDVKTNGFSFGVEVGKRPYDGFFIAGTWSLCLYRKKLASLGYVPPVSEKRTAE